MDKLYLVRSTFYGVLVTEYSAVECTKIMKVKHGSQPIQFVNKKAEISVLCYSNGVSRVWCPKDQVQDWIYLVRSKQIEELTKKIDRLKKERLELENGPARFDPNYDPEEVAAKQGTVTDDMF